MQQEEITVEHPNKTHFRTYWKIADRIYRDQSSGDVLCRVELCKDSEQKATPKVYEVGISKEAVEEAGIDWRDLAMVNPIVIGAARALTQAWTKQFPNLLLLQFAQFGPNEKHKRLLTNEDRNVGKDCLTLASLIEHVASGSWADRHAFAETIAEQPVEYPIEFAHNPQIIVPNFVQ